MIEPKNRRTVISCHRALLNGESNTLIIKVAEKFFNIKYFQEAEEWDIIKFPFLKINNLQVTGSIGVADYYTKIDWYDIAPKEVISKLKNMTFQMPDTSFHEDLL